MKLLLDQNISPSLVSQLHDLYPGSIHVASVGLGSATDETIWEYARDKGLAIVSKDSDLSEISTIRGFPPSVVWIRRGNCSTRDIETLLRNNANALGEIDRAEPGGILVLF